MEENKISTKVKGTNDVDRLAIALADARRRAKTSHAQRPTAAKLNSEKVQSD